jgi:XTP/dITP diphosphohydrolase
LDFLCHFLVSFFMSSDLAAKILPALERVVTVVAQLRTPESGCPWDLAQTPETLMPFVIEEAYEVVDAIARGNHADIAEELGDLLLQVVLQAQIFSEQAAFDLSDIAQGLADKLIRRHPHVFGTAQADTPEAVVVHWERIKAAEKGNPDETQLTPKLERYARTLPPMTAAMKISQKAAKAGFEWPDLDGVWQKVHEELDEFRQALAHEPKANQIAEFGDLLFSLIQIARWCDISPVEALQGTNRRFIERFGLLEAAADKPLADHTIEELEALWQKAKQTLRNQAP